MSITVRGISHYGSVIGSHRTRLRLITFDDLEWPWKAEKGAGFYFHILPYVYAVQPTSTKFGRVTGQGESVFLGEPRTKTKWPGPPDFFGIFMHVWGERYALKTKWPGPPEFLGSLRTPIAFYLVSSKLYWIAFLVLKHCFYIFYCTVFNECVSHWRVYIFVS